MVALLKQIIKNKDDDLFIMANLRPKTTGLPMVIWVSERGNAGSLRFCGKNYI